MNNTLDSIESLVSDEGRGGNPYIADEAVEVRQESATPDPSTKEEDTSSSEVDGPGVANRKRGHEGWGQWRGPQQGREKIEAVSVTPRVSNA